MRNGFWHQSAVFIFLLPALLAAAPHPAAAPRRAKITVLPMLAGGSYNQPLFVTAKGRVVGAAEVPGGMRHAFLWERGAIRDLGTLPGDVESFGRAANDRGQVVGESWSADGTSHAFLWDHGTLYDFGFDPDDFSYATGINDSGQVVGFTSSGPAWHGFLWSRGKFTDLGALPNGFYNEPFAINNAGVVVGDARGDWGYRAFR